MRKQVLDCLLSMSTKRRFEKVNYEKLNGRQKEIFNFQKIAATLADYGFNCIKLADDWQGADFLAYHIDGTTTLRVQLKSSLHVARKYCNKEIWIAFPHEGFWYLIEHDRLLEKVGQRTDWLKSRSWNDMCGYSSNSINHDLLECLAENKLGPVYGLIARDDESATSATGVV